MLELGILYFVSVKTANDARLAIWPWQMIPLWQGCRLGGDTDRYFFDIQTHQLGQENMAK